MIWTKRSMAILLAVITFGSLAGERLRVKDIPSRSVQSRFDADEALLKLLMAEGRDTWGERQLEVIHRRYPDRKDDRIYLSAPYTNNRSLRLQWLTLISKPCSRYAESRIVLALETANATDSVQYWEAALAASKEEKQAKLGAFAERGLWEAMLRSGQAIWSHPQKKSRKDTLEDARLTLLLVEQRLDENGSLSPKYRRCVEGVIKTLTTGRSCPEQSSYVATVEGFELAYAYLLLKKPLKVYGYLRVPFVKP